MDWTRVSTDLYVGSCPETEDDLDVLAELGVGVVVNLQTDDDMAEHSMPWEVLAELYAARGFEVVRVPMVDGVYGSVLGGLPVAVEEVGERLRDGWSVYLHCTWGVNRAPTVAIGCLAVYEAMSVDEAAAHVTELRPCRPYVGAVEEWCA